MTLGLAQRQGDLLDDLNRFCEQALADGSVYALLNRERDRLFPDEMFADLFRRTATGPPTSVMPAPTARCARSALLHARAGPLPSVAMSSASRMPASSSRTRLGSRTTARPDPRLNASSGT